jgi:hypothetical protein
MKFKTFIGLFIVLCVLAAAAFYVYFQGTGKTPAEDMGKPLLQGLPLGQVAKITLISKNDTVVLKKENSRWVVNTRFGYPADFSKITDLIRQLKISRVVRSFNASSDAVARLGLVPPDDNQLKDEDKGIRLQLQDEEDNAFMDILLGKSREAAMGAGAGSYVMFSRGGVIYLVDTDFSKVGQHAHHWLKTRIIDVDAEEIEKITCYTRAHEPVYTLVRREKGQWPVLAGAADLELNKAKLDDLLKTLSPMEILDVAAKAADERIPETAFGYYFDFTFHDGSAFRVAPASVTNAETNETFYLLKAKAFPKPETAVDPGADAMENWVYAIPQWKYKQFLPRTELLVDTPSP